MSKLHDLKSKILSKEQPFNLFDWADAFMNEYGLNFEEFKRLKIPTFYALRESMQRRYERQNKRLKQKPKKRR